MTSATFKFIGGYDNRRTASTITASDAHRMVKATLPSLKTSKPRAPKARSIDEIRDRAVMMGVTFEMQGKVIYLTPSGTSEYYTTNKTKAWQVLDQISADILATLTDDQVFDQANKALELIF